MTLTQRVDALVERGADALEGWARDLAVDGGFKRQVAEELVGDAAFLRKLTPTKIAARKRGETPAEVRFEPSTAPTYEPPPAPTPREPTRSRGGPNPFLVVGIAFVAGVALAKLLDWRGHAFPRW